MDITGEQGRRLMVWLATAEALEAKTNAELADLLVEYVWADFPLTSPQSDLVAEAIARLRT